MYRRRRSHREQIAFGFDCFLDVVANVIGIIVRLILVAWVGARSYTATMKWVEEGPTGSSEPAPKVTDDPLHAEIERARRELDEARARLLARIGEIDGSKRRTAEMKAELDDAANRRLLVETEANVVGSQRSQREGAVRATTLSVESLRQRSKELLKEIKTLETQPVQTKVFKYHAPVSRAVYDDQIRFECRGGRVTFIDMTALVAEMKADMDDRIRELRTQWSVTHVTGPVGAFRLHYTLYREKNPLEAAVGAGRSPSATAGFQLGYRFVLEPMAEQRGETLQTALAPGSEFRALVDRLDPRLTVVTFHVYPDSFGLFRQLRDHLYERDIEVAGAPQPEGEPIAFSPHGVISRGQ